jgi:uncharacterized protein involved in outer membrane biogenesis
MDQATQRIEEPDTPPETPAPALRRRRIIRNILLAVFGTIFAAWAILYITKGRFLKGPFESIVGRMADREVKVRGDFQLYFAPFRIKFLAEGMTISNPGWATRRELFRADRIETFIAPLSLIWGKRRLYSLDMTNGRFDFEWNADHSRNTWTFSDKKGEPFEFPVIDRATVAGTTVRYVDPQMRLLADLGVETIRATNTRIGDTVRLAGDGRVRDTPFTVTATLLSPNETAARGRNQLVAQMRAANNIIDVSGTLPSLADIEDVPLKTRARGRNMAELLAIIGVVLPDTRRYDLRGTMVKADNQYRFTRITGRAGETDLAGRLTITNGDRLHLDSALATRSLDIIDAAPFIGYNPDIVERAGAVAAAAATGAAPARIMPDAEFPVATMRRFDADLKWTIRTVRSRNLPISNIDLTLDLERGRLALSPFSFVMARGNVSSDIVFATRARPAAASYDIRLSPTPMGRLLAGYGVDESGTTGTIRGRINLDGRGDSIHDSLATSRGRIAFVMPSGSFWTRNVQLAELDIGTFVQKMFEKKLEQPVRINCGLLAFTVRNGVAAADPILIDTSKNVILGRGGFSFRDETMDLAFRADGKKFSLFSGQSPVGLGGYFSQPRIDVVSEELLGRAGAGLGLAIVATPLAGVLAFVDVGDAKSAACGPVLAGARAAGQRTTKGKQRDDVGRGTTSKEENGGKRKKFLGIF